MTAIRFHHIALNCKTRAATEAFYTKHFGFSRSRVVDLGQTQIVFLKSEGVYLELFQADPAVLLPPQRDGYTWPGERHLAFKVDDVNAKLAEMGSDAKISLGPLNFDAFIPGWASVWISDPEGNIVEISQGYVDQENPPPPPAA